MEDNAAARQQSLIDLEELYVWLQQFEDPNIGKPESHSFPGALGKKCMMFDCLLSKSILLSKLS